MADPYASQKFARHLDHVTNAELDHALESPDMTTLALPRASMAHGESSPLLDDGPTEEAHSHALAVHFGLIHHDTYAEQS